MQKGMQHQMVNDSPILTTKVVVLESIFDYLSVSDLCSIGRTCTTLQQIAGCYFRYKYPAQDVTIRGRDKYTESIDWNESNFAPFAQRFEIWVHSDDDLLSYVTENVNENPKALVFRSTESLLDLAPMKNILKNVEYLKFQDVGKCKYFSDNLAFFENLKYLCVEVSNLKFFYDRRCPTLETLEIDFNYKRSSFDLITFLKVNPQIQRLSMKHSDMNFMLDIIDEAKPTSLDLLSIYTYQHEKVQIAERLNHLHDLGYFKRLSFSGSQFSFVNDICNVRNLTGLFISYCGQREQKIDEIGRKLSEMDNFVDFNISHINNGEAEILSRYLTNIEEVNLFDSSFNHLIVFLRRLPKLKLASSGLGHYYDLNFSLKEINDERAKLPNARKVVVYVGDESCFQSLRWKFVELNFDYLEIRRITQFCHYE